jgi:hypothetical protein
MATPMRAPTIDWVVDTGNPRYVQTVSHIEEPKSLESGVSKLKPLSWNFERRLKAERTDFGNHHGHYQYSW